MIPWYWLVVAFSLGDLLGFTFACILTMSGRVSRIEEREGGRMMVEITCCDLQCNWNRGGKCSQSRIDIDENGFCMSYRYGNIEGESSRHMPVGLREKIDALSTFEILPKYAGIRFVLKEQVLSLLEQEGKLEDSGDEAG